MPSETSMALPEVRLCALMPSTVPVCVRSAVSATRVPVKAPVLEIVVAPLYESVEVHGVVVQAAS